MFSSQFWKWVYGISGALVLSAIGSGLWESLFHPGISWVSTAILDIASHTIKSFKDNMYLEIATGNHERAGILILMLILGLTYSIMLVITLGTHLTWRSTKRRFLKIQEKQVGETEENPDESIATLTAQIDRGVKVIQIALPVTYIVLVIGFAGAAILVAKINYIIAASSKIEQLETIVAPFLSHEEQIKFKARVATVSSKEDFVNVLSDLQAVARAHNINLPEFTAY